MEHQIGMFIYPAPQPEEAAANSGGENKTDDEQEPSHKRQMVNDIMQESEEHNAKKRKVVKSSKPFSINRKTFKVLKELIEKEGASKVYKTLKVAAKATE